MFSLPFEMLSYLQFLNEYWVGITSQFFCESWWSILQDPNDCHGKRHIEENFRTSYGSRKKLGKNEGVSSRLFLLDLELTSSIMP